MKFFMLYIVALFVVTSCGMKNQKPVEITQSVDGVHHVTVKEVQQTSAYTYMLVQQDNQEYWIAVSRMDASEGDEYYFEKPLEMTNFKSKELDKTFESILFVNNISANPANVNQAEITEKLKPAGKKLEEFNEEISIEKTAGAVQIAELYENPSKYNGETIKVKGEVVKVNENIMGRNWIHIQDGTKHNDQYDLTITSDQSAKVGDVIEVEGEITLDKDFGAGYFYDLIMEKGKILGKI